MRQMGDPDKARILQRYFKTGTGEYAEGDRFIGLKVPQVRQLLGEYRELMPADTLPLLASPIHEERLFALLALVRCFENGDESSREGIYTLYLVNTVHINNWDLVDVSAPQVVGGFLLEKDPEPLYLLARSQSIWERRIAIMATFTFIRHNRFEVTMRIARLLLHDRDDLLHKAVGWMLREVGKRKAEVEERFLKEHCRIMPRTMLRYATEKFPEEKRQIYLKGVC
jgi:3-methyladenine DNA glycosylase AlkD